MIDRTSGEWRAAFFVAWNATAGSLAERSRRLEICCEKADEAVEALKDAIVGRLPPAEPTFCVPDELKPIENMLRHLRTAVANDSRTATAFYRGQLVRVLDELPPEDSHFRVNRARDWLASGERLTLENLASLELAVFGGRLPPDGPRRPYEPDEINADAVALALETVSAFFDPKMLASRDRLNHFLDKQPEVIGALHIIGLALELPPERLQTFLDRESAVLWRWTMDALAPATRAAEQDARALAAKLGLQKAPE